MKNLLRLFPIFLLLFSFTACEGPRGPVGPEGPEGPGAVMPVAFHVDIDLLESNDFEFFHDIPSEIEVLDQDVMLAYVLEDVDDDLDVWRKLPLTDFTNRGTRLMDYDFTLADIRIFLDANYSLGEDDEFTGLPIRAVHIPADFIAGKQADATFKDALTFHKLEEMLGMEIQVLKD